MTTAPEVIPRGWFLLSAVSVSVSVFLPESGIYRQEIKRMFHSANRQGEGRNYCKSKKIPGTIAVPGIFSLAQKEGFEPSHGFTRLLP